MLDFIIRLLLGIALRTADQVAPDRLCVEARVYAAYYRGDWSPGRTTRDCGWTNLPSVEGTLALEEFGLDPYVVEVSTTGVLEACEAQHILGGPLWEEVDGKHKMTKAARTHFEYNPERGYTLKPISIFMDEAVLARYIMECMPAGITHERIIPGPLRLLQSRDNAITVMLSRKGTPTFKALCKKHGLDYKAVARRFPKDAWNDPIGERRKVRLLVTAAREDGSHDGNFFLKSRVAHSNLCLYRGMGKHNGKAFLVKGRGISADHLVLNDYDGIISQDNIKWNSVPAGTVIELDLIPATEESGHAKEGGYGWHSMAMLFMESTVKQNGKMYRAFQGHVERLSSKFPHKISAEGFAQSLKHMAAEEDGFAVVNSDLAKHTLGLSSAVDRRAIWTSEFQKVLTMKSKVSQYPAVIFATEWEGKEITPEAPLFNGAMLAWAEKHGLVGTDVTAMRYPVASKGSYLRVTLKAENAISLVDSDPLMILHPRCAKHVQGDGDDHMLVTADWVSGFDPNNEPAQTRAYEKCEPGNVLESLLQVWKASSGIGLIFNAMAKSVGAMRALDMPESKIEAEMLWFGSQLDLYAQAVKKPYVLTEPSMIAERGKSWMEEAEGVKDRPEYQLGSLIGTNLRGEDATTKFGDLVNAFYNQTLPEVPGANPIPENLRVRRMADENLVKKHLAAASRVKWIGQARKWHKELVQDLLGEGTWEDLDTKATGIALDTYAEIAIRIGHTAQQSEEWPLTLAVMNGNWIAATQVIGDGYLK